MHIYPYRHKQPTTILGDNIFFTRKQLCQMLDISTSHLSKQLKHILKIPGCQVERFRINPLYICNLQLRLSGPNYSIPTVLTSQEFQDFTAHLMPYALED